MVNAYFWIAITVGGFLLGSILNRRFKTVIFNELLLSTVVVIAVMKLTKTEYTSYMEGGRYIGFLLTPATASLGVKMYKNIKEIGKNTVPIFTGIVLGMFSSFTCMWILKKMFGLTAEQYATVLPKSITAAIAKGVSEALGGNSAICTATVILTGIFIGVFGRWLIKLFRIKNPIAVGVALGCSGHGQGTALALKHSDTAGAVASLSMCISALATVVVAPMFFGVTT